MHRLIPVRHTNSTCRRSYSSRQGGFKAKKLAQKMAKSYIPELTPQCFTKKNPYAGTFRDKISKISVPRMLDRRHQLSLHDPRERHAFTDLRQMGEEQWRKSSKRDKLLQAIRESDLEGDLFKARSEFMPDFRSALHDNLSINLTVFFPHTENLAANDADALFDHAMFGNYIECAHTEKPGEVYMRFADPAKLYTMVMVCPDHPSRVNPDGHLVHWMVANIPGDKVDEGDVIKPYLPPLPTEYAGAFRYAFLVYEQTQRIEDTQNLMHLLPKEAQDFSYVLERQPSIARQKRDSKHALKQQYLNAYPYEREYWEKLEEEEERKELDLDLVDESSVYCSDYRPPPPKHQADEKTMQDWTDRQRFDLEAFATQQSFVSPLPVGLCFFQTDYDINVSQRYESMGIQEPFYIPVDFQVKVAKKEVRATRENNFLRNQWV